MRLLLLAGACSLALAGASAAAERPWTMLPGRNLTIVGQQSPKTLRRIAVEIEQFRLALGALVPGARHPLSMPTMMYIFDDQKAFDAFVPLYKGKPASLAGYCHCGAGAEVNFIAASLAGYSDASSIILHEYTHLLVRNAETGVPVWLNEGLAEYFSTFRLTSDGTKADVGRPIDHHLRLLRRRYVPVGELVAVDETSALYNETDRRSVFYATAWALTHYLLIERPGGAEGVNRLIGATAAGRPAPEAFREAFGVTPGVMDKELQRYLQRPSYQWVTYTLTERVGVDPPEGARTLSAAEAQARLGGVQMRVGRLDEAAARIEAAAASAAPGEAQPQLELALLRLQEGRHAEALASLRTAAALAPDDFLTQYTYALVLLRNNANAPTEATESPELAHAALARALAVHPESAAALAWQAYADLVLDTRLDEARGAITRAMELVPGRLDYRLRLAEICLRQGERAEARRLLMDLAAVPGDDGAVKQARALLAHLGGRR